MRLNELISVIDAVACIVVFNLDGKQCSTYINSHAYSDIFNHSELYTVKSVYTTNNRLVIEVEYD